MLNLLGLDLPQLTAHLAQMGEKPFRAKQLLQWMHQSGEADFSRMTDLARSLREKLQQGHQILAPQQLAEQCSADGTRKWALSVDGRNAIETVFIPEQDRGTLCVSSQVGCTLACAFCSTGRQGFNRNLDAAEIIGQLWWANRALGRLPRGERIIDNVVLMGMGEPLLNLEQVLPALHLMLDDHAYGLSRRRVTVSTAGVIPGMDILREDCAPALAVSLHAPDDVLRDTLVPLNRKYPLRELMAACSRYLQQAPRDFITFEYVLLDGVNDAPAQAHALLALTRDVPCKFNLIPFNPHPGSPYQRPDHDAVRRFREILQAAGSIVTTRRTRGEDIDAACGQLAGQVDDRTRRTVRLEAA